LTRFDYNSIDYNAALDLNVTLNGSVNSPTDLLHQHKPLRNAGETNVVRKSQSCPQEKKQI